MNNTLLKLGLSQEFGPPDENFDYWVEGDRLHLIVNDGGYDLPFTPLQVQQVRKWREGKRFLTPGE